MGTPLIFGISAIVVFSCGFLVGQYSGKEKSSTQVAKVMENRGKIESETIVVKSDINPTFEEWKVSGQSNPKDLPPIATDHSQLAQKYNSDEVVDQDSDTPPPPLSEDELNSIMESQASSSSEEAILVEKQMRESNISLLEWTLADMMEAGEPEELIQDLRDDLNHLKEEVPLAASNEEFSVEMTAEDSRDELLQSLSSEGVPSEEGQKMASDMLSHEVEQALEPLEPYDPPPPLAQ